MGLCRDTPSRLNFNFSEQNEKLHSLRNSSSQISLLRTFTISQASGLIDSFTHSKKSVRVLSKHEYKEN